MKAKYLLIALTLIFSRIVTKAQYIKTKINFPVGIHISATGRPPNAGAVWIGPEWVWRNDKYQCIQGHWDKPKRRGSNWIPGFWKYSRRGYKWIPGHWN